MAHYSIRDLEQLTGIKTHTLRMWERRYGIIQPARTPTNIRYYCDKDLRKLLNISILNDNGFRISYLSSLDEEQLSDMARECSECSENKESGVDMLTLATIEFDEPKIEQKLEEAFTHFGFEKTFEKVLLPFLDKLGLLWQVGTINTAQEHFISNILRSRFIQAIDALPSMNDSERPVFLLYLPEEELHEFSLMFAHYTIKKNGFRSYYFGQTLPLEDLRTTVREHAPCYLMTFFVSAKCSDIINEHLDLLSNESGIDRIFIAGEQTHRLESNALPDKVVRLSQPSELSHQLEALKSIQQN